MKNEALKKITSEVAASFAAWLETAETKSAIAATRAASDGDTGTFEIVITTENLDRYQEVIKLDGWDTSNYMNNPVVLLSHDSYMPPIGITTGLRVENGKMIATGKFAPASANPVAQQIRQLYDLGIMRAASVGFMEKEREGNLITKAELLEWSFVSIPANPMALSTMVKSGLSIDEFITKGIVSVKEGEPENGSTEPQDEPAEPVVHPDIQEDAEPAPAVEPTEVPTVPESEPDAKTIKPLLADLRTVLVALEAAVETGESEGDEKEVQETEDQKAFREFSEKRRKVQEVSTIIGDVLAEARRAVEARK